MAGKGDKRRVEDLHKIRRNWDKIDWSRKETKKEKKK